MPAVFQEKAWSYAKMKEMLRALGARLTRTSFIGWDNEQWNAVGDWAWHQLFERIPCAIPERCRRRPKCADLLFAEPKKGRKR